LAFAAFECGARINQRLVGGRGDLGGQPLIVEQQTPRDGRVLREWEGRDG
jgi:hypothetical protein